MNRINVNIIPCLCHTRLPHATERVSAILRNALMLTLMRFMVGHLLPSSGSMAGARRAPKVTALIYQDLANSYETQAVPDRHTVGVETRNSRIDFSPTSLRLLARPFDWLRRRCRLNELRIVDGNVLFYVAHLDSEPPAGARQRPSERNLDAIHIAVIRIINLGRKQSQRGVAETYHPHQQSGLLVEIEPDRRLALALSHHDMGLALANLLRSARLHLAEHRLQMRR